MPKRNQLSVEVVPVPEPDFVAIKVVALIDSKIHATGEVSGKEYFFDGAGSVQDVDERDVQSLLDKRQGEKQCCGGTGKGNAVFALAEV